MTFVKEYIRAERRGKEAAGKNSVNDYQPGKAVYAFLPQSKRISGTSTSSSVTLACMETHHFSGGFLNQRVFGPVASAR